ncbi:MAG: hypothetical protein KBD64_03925 [Gammaproteobacteria bacterium]|nr:hypothetical protein [Gammaproteobacteria bacterium]
MVKFNKKIEQLRLDLDDLIIYLENIGKSDKSIRKVRNQLDNIDPFVRINSAIAAESIITSSKLCNLH